MYNTYGPGALLEDDTRLYDLESDPGQEKPLADAAVEARMVDLMARLMRANHAPPEAFTRLGLTPGRCPIAGAPAKTVGLMSGARPPCRRPAPDRQRPPHRP